MSEDPPRPSDHSLVHNEMAGYMAGRGDFTTEYDNFMELDLRHMEFDREELDPLETGLYRLPDKSAYWNIIFLIFQPKHMLWVLKRTVSMTRFF